jgi:hypothetical protein
MQQLAGQTSLASYPSMTHRTCRAVERIRSWEKYLRGFLSPPIAEQILIPVQFILSVLSPNRDSLSNMCDWQSLTTRNSNTQRHVLLLDDIISSALTVPRCKKTLRIMPAVIYHADTNVVVVLSINLTRVPTSLPIRDQVGYILHWTKPNQLKLSTVLISCRDKV